MWARIWSQTVWNSWHIPTGILPHIILLLSHHLNFLVLLRTYSHLTPPRPPNFQICLSLHEVSNSRPICIWVFAQHLEVSPGTGCCSASGFLLCVSFDFPFWNRLLFGPLDESGLCRGSVGGVDFAVGCCPYGGGVCVFYKEVWAYLEWVFL